MALERCVFLSHFLELDSRRFIGIYPVNMFPSKMKLVVYKKLAGIYSTKVPWVECQCGQQGCC